MMEPLKTLGNSDSDHEASNFDFYSGSIRSESVLMNVSLISSSSSQESHRYKSSQNISSRKAGVSSSCRFPKLEECAHFHYERVQLGNILIRLINDKSEMLVGPGNSTQSESQTPQQWFIIRISAGRSEPFLIKRSLQNLKMLDEMLHRCVYDRRVSDLRDLNEDLETTDDEELEDIVSLYLSRLSTIASDAMTCGPVLTWLQLDNKGRRLPVADSDTMLTINTPAVGAAYGIRRYVAQACDEISIEVGDMISVIDMPSPAESIWWRGKKNHFQKNQYEVGFFPQNCVATIGEKVPRHMPLPAPLVGSLALSPTKPVLRKHGKLITFFRSFILARPSRRRLKQTGIYKERVFSCDLGEHLMNSGQDIPMVLKCCAEFIEKYGIVDGVYRLSGITSNIQKLRRAFDEERIPDLMQTEIKQDIHAVTSLLKMYFRELPNPLCTYQLYDNFVEAIQVRSEIDETRLKMIKQTVRKLPPPHYRTLKYLACHLNRIAKHSVNTGMTERNIAIVWAPNLLRSPALESGGVAALRGVGVQAVVTEYLIVNSEKIFDDANYDFDCFNSSSQPPSLSDTSSIQTELRDTSLSLVERPKSLGIGPPKLISLEEARSRKNAKEIEKVMPVMPTSTNNSYSSYIEVGGGPASLPDKYHTVLPVPRNWNKRKTNSWKSIFQRGDRRSDNNVKSKLISNPIVMDDTSKVNETEVDENQSKLPIIVSASNSANSSFKEKKKLAKSFDTLDATANTLASEASCQRSCSIDSFRTAGHSRSVSHDSYFDLLQSPLRGSMTTYPSKEMSELRLNFDREEPEMRIFSESESLVSSPKMNKDSSILRRVHRSRPEKYKTEGKSVNMSSPNESKVWTTIINEAENENSIKKEEPPSSLKRCKLEDQLSDIQYIDSSTPEHSGAKASSTIPNTNKAGVAIYTQIQIHNQPTMNAHQGQHKTIIDTTNIVPLRQENDRYSYPVTQYSVYGSKKEERFSYPIGVMSFVKDFSYKSDDDDNDKLSSDVNKMCQSQSQSNVRESFEADSELFKNSEMNSSKLSSTTTTTQSPLKSPCYSLLIGSNSSSTLISPINIPIYDCNQYEQPLSLKNVEQENEMSLELMKQTTLASTHQSLTTSDIKTETDNTSPSITPSEISYQKIFNRQSAFTPEVENLCEDSNEANLIVKPTIVHVPSSSSSPQNDQSNDITNPIRSSIKITYNLRSPALSETNQSNFSFENFSEKEKQAENTFLETSFDELPSRVYENMEFHEKKSNMPDDHYENVFKSIKINSDNDQETYDSIELDQDCSFYENVELRRKEKVEISKEAPSNNLSKVRKLSSNYEKKQLEQLQLSNYDFQKSPSIKSEVQLRKVSNRNPENFTMTRSLDENAFIREFGSARKFEEFNKCIKEIDEFTSNSNRKSTDYSKPKTLGQPKTLPSFSQHIPKCIEHSRYLVDTKTSPDDSDRERHKLHLNIGNLNVYVENQRSQSCGSERTPLQTYNARITPTTENRISLIQSNFESGIDKRKGFDDDKATSATSLTSLKMLKLDRERIEKIKEERRHQMNEKYRSESFRNLNNNIKFVKPKLKEDSINMDDDDINNQRFKSKSRNQLDSEESFNAIGVATSSSASNLTLHGRVRRISDEKNQNNINSGGQEQPFMSLNLNTKESAIEASNRNIDQQYSPIKIKSQSFKMNDEGNSSGSNLQYCRTSLQNDFYTRNISIKDVAAMFETRSSHQQSK
ncbi:CLUMA_CG020965, isoform A [Clunio marinus]|uniref:CLUMA_CG020965, isoform A n=1 Tax=Clunio marinus TaxID=568069 RepID=A0A1J1J889_9DIPT|nr:CLUMA_CG020965, isoform A [Clunio marinus]